MLSRSSRLLTTSTSILYRGVFNNAFQTSNVVFTALTGSDSQKRFLTTKRENPMLPLIAGIGIAGCCLVAKSRAENYKNKTDGKGDHTYALANYYQGGFEKEMTKREAALILGVRTNSDQKRIQKAYRTILLKNHPDKGGSPYLAAKVNQAKDILLGNQEVPK
ncbi:mitochondrial import inner membrane translocase subunit TIM14 [Blastocystis sp. subtype 4]|uniref:mitochondrial import inner membrane translocase subunit TIM14 n=1 Tax=Blastocystis sp. subtype 4 TaxID=944170 RepID=UPI000711FAD7|nr:mitochondrial import inner membrane translocase subunit TIM14 [Blastocystis sp. subtype 4]KNB41982.1 mitochondrial import inner membrane translocase subunit TIM14 [Blastocystis sp. subtype 4]|eukprot:XP_014525425.1 mitochondrial import inner membrane translocase subunit TIM14 [Blastocystis sp. subtype 4]